MIYEYAIDPQLIAAAGARSRYRFWAQKFGLGSPRVMSQFPKLQNWKRQVLRALPADTRDAEKTRVVELVQRLTELTTPRVSSHYDGHHGWLENAEAEHARAPFRGILAWDNPRLHDAVLIAEPLEEFDETDKRWVAQRGRVVTRDAASMADAVSSMLACCRDAVFVDPHFKPAFPRYQRPIEAFLNALVTNRAGPLPERVEICTATPEGMAFLERAFTSRIRALVPDGLSVRVRKLVRRDGGEALHNRYILTDLGGVSFGYGLDDDDGEGGQTDDLTLMDREQYQKRWQQYCGDNPAFDCDGEFVL